MYIISNINDMNIGIVDYKTHGHHIYYINTISQFIKAKNHQTTLFTVKGPPNIEDIKACEGNLHISEDKSVKYEDYVNTNGFRSFIQKVGLMSRTIKRASDIGISHLFILSFEELAAASCLAGQYNTLCRTIPPVRALMVVPNVLRINEKDLSNHVKKIITKNAVIWAINNGVIEDLFLMTCEDVKRLKSQVNDPERVHHIPDPVVPVDNTDDVETSTRVLNLPKTNRTRVLFFGRLTEAKGIRAFLKSIPLVDEKIVCVLAGQPMCEIESLISDIRKKLNSRKTLVPRIKYIDEDRVNHYFRYSDVVVLPYKDKYIGTSGVLQKAAACGVPVIGTECGEIGRAIRRWNLGLTIRESDHVELAAALSQFVRNKTDITERAVRGAEDYCNLHAPQNMLKTMFNAII
jgi:glycosyltransferase involved in cell wall biosynthesis